MIGEQPVRATIYKIDDTTVCVFHVPKGSVGKSLGIGYSITGQGPQLYIAEGLVKPKLIRR
jgi:hypothetical protein